MILGVFSLYFSTLGLKNLTYEKTQFKIQLKINLYLSYLTIIDLNYSICSVFETQLILESRDLTGHTHFWPGPPYKFLICF